MKHLGASRQGVHACTMAAGLMRNISHVTADALTFDALRASYKILKGIYLFIVIYCTVISNLREALPGSVLLR